MSLFFRSRISAQEDDQTFDNIHNKKVKENKYFKRVNQNLIKRC